MTSAMTLSPADIDHLAMLARLGLTSNERGIIASQLDNILDHVSTLSKVDTAHVDETARVTELVDVWRDDVMAPSFLVDVALRNAPQRDGQYFKVGAIQE